MPTFYFGIWDGHRVKPDEYGVSLSDAERAFELAVKTARKILSTGLRKGEDRSGWAFHVHNDRGVRLFTLRFSVVAIDPHYVGDRVPRRRAT
jgi:hypothetical protein